MKRLRNLLHENLPTPPFRSTNGRSRRRNSSTFRRKNKAVAEDFSRQEFQRGGMMPEQRECCAAESRVQHGSFREVVNPEPAAMQNRMLSRVVFEIEIVAF